MRLGPLSAGVEPRRFEGALALAHGLECQRRKVAQPPKQLRFVLAVIGACDGAIHSPIKFEEKQERIYSI